MNKNFITRKHDDVPYVTDDEQGAETFWKDAILHNGVKELRRRRGEQKAPTKEMVSIRLDKETLEQFRAMGKGWQSKINSILHDWLEKNPVNSTRG